jgi:hypothetical protein
MADMGDDKKILEQIGIAETDLRDLFQKYNTFLNSLSAAQRNLFLNSEVTLGHAARTLHGVSPEQLRQFLQKYAPPGGFVPSICGHHRRRDEPEGE